MLSWLLSFVCNNVIIILVQMNIIRVTKSENFLWEKLASSAVDHISQTEEHLSEVCEAFGNYVRKAAKLRNASDDLANALHKFSTSECIKDSKSLKKCLQLLSDSIATVADLRDQQVNLIASKAVKKFTHFGPICKKTKNDIKNLEKFNEKPSSKIKSNKGGGDSTESTVMLENGNITKEVEEIIYHFEDNNLMRMKNILSDFTKTELMYHCKAVEVLTEASICVNEFDNNQDLHDIKIKLKDVVSSSETNKLKTSTEILLPYNTTEMSMDKSGPGSYHHHTILGGHDDESSIECTTESSHA